MRILAKTLIMIDTDYGENYAAELGARNSTLRLLYVIMTMIKTYNNYLLWVDFHKVAILNRKI